MQKNRQLIKMKQNLRRSDVNYLTHNASDSDVYYGASLTH